MTKLPIFLSMHLTNITLVTGPARSGKSQWAENLLKTKKNVVYLATSASDPTDNNWLQKIQIHKNRRPSSWQVIETGPDPGQHLIGKYNKNPILLDSLGGFIAYHLDKNDFDWSMEKDKFLNALNSTKEIVVIVIEEVGWGVVPATTTGCRFRERIGLLSQELQAISTESWLVVQGLAIDIKKIGIPIQ